MGRATYTWPTGRTAGCRSSAPGAIIWPPLAGREQEKASWDFPRTWPWTAKGTCTLRIGATNRLNIYAPDGSFITGFSGDAVRLSVWAQDVVKANPDYLKARRRADLSIERWFSRPAAVNVDGEGRIMVVDTLRARIQVYVKERDFSDAQFNL